MSACEPQSVAGDPPIRTTSSSARASLAPHTQQDEPSTVIIGAPLRTREWRAKLSPALVASMSRAANESKAAAIGALAGLALIGGVVVWRLAGTTLVSDVETICRAEVRSGLTLAKDMPALNVWLRGHVATPAGNELLSRLGDAPVVERGPRLRNAAGALGIAECPVARSYEGLVADGEYRADLERLCSYVTFPDLAGGDDAARLAALEEWIENRASNVRTKALADPLRSAGTPAERAHLLRAASREMDIFTCDVAKTLESPPPAPDGG